MHNKLKMKKKLRKKNYKKMFKFYQHLGESSTVLDVVTVTIKDLISLKLLYLSWVNL